MRLERSSVNCVVWCLLLCYFSKGDKVSGDPETCFCKLVGEIDDCSCSVDTVDHFNNFRVFPLISSIVTKTYFRYYRVQLSRKCPFWSDDSRCSLKDCHVQSCKQGDIPEGIIHEEENEWKPSAKYLEKDCDDELGSLDRTLSTENIEEFNKWKKYDAQESFCDLYDDDSNDLVYVDLLLNPERYTGYKGESSHRIWRSIYEENCFKPENNYEPYGKGSKLGSSDQLKDMCLEKRAFFRSVSGLHTSINVHLCKSYPYKTFGSEEIAWKPNLDQFKWRFDPKLTNGESIPRLKNLYFLYLLELRALVKAAPFLESIDYFTGREDDEDVKGAVMALLKNLKQFKHQFDELSMFTKGDKKLKREFRDHFKNITRIMDCVGCDKCRLWGKLQIHGLGTALKILFSGHTRKMENFTLPIMKKVKFALQRDEIVALVNGFARLSSSIQALEMFRGMVNR